MADIIVLGAGMAGVGAALALRSRGHAVTIVDRRGPGEETSFGNAGAIQAEAVAPYPMPRDLPTLWRYATGRTNDVVWHARHLPSVARALVTYYRESAPHRHAKAGETYAKLIKRVRDDHGRLVADAGAGDLIRRTGLGELYRNPQELEAEAAAGEKKARAHGLGMRVLETADLRTEDPAIGAALAGAIVWDDSWSCTDPGALVQAYAGLFADRGGRLLRGDASTLSQTGTGWRVDTADGAIDAAQAVVALGPWSATLLARFGYRVRMLSQRGYHTHFPQAPTLSRPYLDADYGIVLSSMRRGLRMTTGAELVAQNAKGSRRQLVCGARAAAELMGIAPDSRGEIWHGHRPFMPDFLPLVGPAPEHAGLWFHFGHGHHGFTLGPTTGEILADQIGGTTAPDWHPLLPAVRL